MVNCSRKCDTDLTVLNSAELLKTDSCIYNSCVL